MNADDRDQTRTLELLAAIEENSSVTQRHLAQRMGIALGLANSYLKRCARKGLIKIQQAPANRYLYYLTPKGFAEKSRLTAEYLRYSLGFYRRASDSVGESLGSCRARGQSRVVLCGASDLAEIAMLHAAPNGVRVVAICDPGAAGSRLADRIVRGDLPPDDDFDACVVTDVRAAQQVTERLLLRVGRARLRVPSVLGVTLDAPPVVAPAAELAERGGE